MKNSTNNRDGYLNSVNLNATDPFPYLVLDVEGDDSRPRNPGFRVMHWHDDLQFIYALEGQVDIVTPDRSATITSGEGIFINSGVIHLVQRAGTCRYKSFIFPKRLITFYPGSPAATMVDRLAGNPAVPVYTIDRRPCNQGLLHHLKSLSELGQGATPESAYRILIELCTLWLELDTAVGPHRPDSPDRLTDRRLRTFLNYIEEHYAEPLALDELAQSAHVSKSECLRCFKTSLQTTPHRYLVEYRLARAAELLRSTDEPVGAIARGVGFGQQSHFGKCFKAKTGVTPAEYRAQHRFSAR